MLPELTKPQWKKLVDGSLKYNFTSFTIRSAISRVRVAYKLNKLTIDEAVIELQNSFKKNYDIVEQDINIIFKN